MGLWTQRRTRAAANYLISFGFFGKNLTNLAIAISNDALVPKRSWLLHVINNKYWSFVMHYIEILNKLLKNELSATETYRQVLDKLQENIELGDSEYLGPIYEAHKDVVSILQAQIRQLGGTPCEDSGAWGTWAEILLGGANLLGKNAILQTLQVGEKIGIEDYNQALLNTDLPSDMGSLIESKLLTAQQAHVRTLDRLLNVATA
jgi:hypothetical protein